MNRFADTRFRSVFLVFILVYVVIYKFADGLTIQTHSDPFYYHLAGAKLLLNRGLPTLAHDLQGYAQAGLFDLLYLIPFFITKNLIAIQLMAQEMHIFFSLFLGAFLVHRWVPNKALGILAAISIITIARDFAFFVYAKNDGVVALVTLVAAYFVYRRKSPLWIGLTLGLIPSIKMSGLICSAALALIYALKNRHHLRNVILAGIVSFLTLLPMLIKNNYFTRDPFFPALIHTFPGSLSALSQAYYLHFFAEPPTWSSISHNFYDLLLGKAVYWLGFGIAVWKIKNRNYRGLEFFFAAILIFCLYTFSHGVYQGARFFFSVYFLLIFFTFLELSKLNISRNWYWPLLILVLIDGNVDFTGRRIYGNLHELTSHTEEELLQTHILQMQIVNAMDRHPSEDFFIYSDCRSESFHLDPHYRLIQREQSRGADFFQRCTAESDLARVGMFRYFWIGHPLDNACYRAIQTQSHLVKTVQFDGETYAIYEHNLPVR